jgi:hypothetical protein
VPRLTLRELTGVVIAVYAVAAYFWRPPSWGHAIATVVLTAHWLQSYLVAPVLGAMNRAADDYWH